MIYLSSQPDSLYFLWQLQFQIFNFKEIGILPHQVHVLIGFDELKGLNRQFETFINTSKDALFFVYPDTRIKKNYSVSLRPHIIAKHLTKFPELVDRAIFFHDADIIFRTLPNLEELLKDDAWYASDTGHYLNSQYIKQSGGQELFKKMCGIVGVSTKEVEDNDEHAGGAQFIFKKSDIEFWNKVEIDCENMFQLLTKENALKGFCYKEGKIQDWCAEMWVLWWNALYFKKEFRVAQELEFCWADSEIRRWENNNILHYTGLVKADNKALFCKGNYTQYPPFFDDFTKIDKERCSYPLAQLIERYRTFHEHFRIDLEDVTFIFNVENAGDDEVENLAGMLQYLQVSYKAKIIIVETGASARLRHLTFSPDITYHFIKHGVKSIDYVDKDKLISGMINTPYIGVFNEISIISHNQILSGVKMLRSEEATLVRPFEGDVLKVDSVIKTMFFKFLDARLLQENHGKFRKVPVIENDSIDCCFFLTTKNNFNQFSTNENPEISFSCFSKPILEKTNAARIPGSLYLLGTINGRTPVGQSFLEGQRLCQL